MVWRQWVTAHMHRQQSVTPPVLQHIKHDTWYQSSNYKNLYISEKHSNSEEGICEICQLLRRKIVMKHTSLYIFRVPDEGSSAREKLPSSSIFTHVFLYYSFPWFYCGEGVECFETWSLTLREECRLRVFENRILRRIFGPKRDENGEQRWLHNEELHSLYRSPNIIRVIKSVFTHNHYQTIWIHCFTKYLAIKLEEYWKK